MPAREITGGYVVREANGQALAFVFHRPTAEAMQAKVLTPDEAHRIEAAGIAEPRTKLIQAAIY